MKKILLLIAFVTFCATIGQSQTKKAYIEAAEEAYLTQNYYGALKWFGEALEFEEDNVDLLYKYAESARNFEAYDLAADKYKLLVDSLAEDQYPDAAYHLGIMYQRLGKYEEAKKYLNIYNSEYSELDEEKTNDALRQIEALDFAIEKIDDIDKSAELTQLESEVNTPYSEFGAYKKDSTLYFSTMRYAEKNPSKYPPRSVSKLHTLENDMNSVIEEDINETDSLVAHTAFSSDGSTLYYTLCEYVDDENVRCNLYTRPVNEDGTFGSAYKLPAPLNIDSITTTHPSITYDSIQQKDILYFVSDREGGQGKLDIYYTSLNENGSYGELVNFEEINTKENDATPFMHGPSKTIYFSTDGRQGLGGYDVFSSTKTKNTWTTPEIMRVPVNSSYHDLYYTLDRFGEEAYFSSNRESSAYLDAAKKACCFDIYKVKYDEVIIEMNALVFDDFTKEDLAGATVTLIDLTTGDTIKTLTNLDGNDFFFKLAKDKEYKVIATRPYYNDEEFTFSTIGISESTNIEKKIYMKTDKMQLKVLTFNKRTQAELEGVQIRIKNLTTNTIDTIAINELGNDFHFYVDTGNKYEIEASKFGFVTETSIVDLTNVTEPGLITEKMYLEVFDIEDYMPVTVYFENDFPDPKSKSTTTTKIYGNLYNDYIANKQDYIKKRTKRLNSNDKASVTNNLDNFFEGEVAGGYAKLKRFMRALKKELELGRSLEIAIKGYASPIADTRYNLALGQRRVTSIKNEILSYEGGIFREYVRNGKLILTDISYGEETSPKDVSDRKSDVNNSVYSVEASKERRVQIVKITDQ